MALSVSGTFMPSCPVTRKGYTERRYSGAMATDRRDEALAELLGVAPGARVGIDLPLVLALDHAPAGLSPGLRSIARHIDQASATPVVAVLANYGVAKRVRAHLSDTVGLIVRADGNETGLSQLWTNSPNWGLFFPPAVCAASGANAIAVNLLLGGPAEFRSLTVVADAICAAQESNTKVLVSAIALDANNEGNYAASHVPERIAYAARIAEEMGADVVNVYSQGSRAALTASAAVCSGPLIAANPPQNMLAEWCDTARNAGYRGFCVGSMLWEHAAWSTLAQSVFGEQAGQ